MGFRTLIARTRLMGAIFILARMSGVGCPVVEARIWAVDSSCFVARIRIVGNIQRIARTYKSGFTIYVAPHVERRFHFESSSRKRWVGGIPRIAAHTVYRFH